MSWKRQLCITLGSALPQPVLKMTLGVAELVEIGGWMRSSGYTYQKLPTSRATLFREVAREIEERNVLYMEFGVWQGASIRFWSDLLKNPASNLHGFDSFEGLPEDWVDGYPKGHFSTNGNVPTVPDPRVKFFKGWFQETLPTYTPPPHDVMVVSIDCDLYEPAHYVLEYLAHLFRPGDFLYFDEFYYLQHEVRAFREFTGKNRNLAFELVGATRGLQGAVFKCTKN